MVLPSMTNWTVASDEERKTNMAVVAWLASAVMPSSKSKGPMMMPPPIPRKPPKKPATTAKHGYIIMVCGVHSKMPSADSPATDALLPMSLAPATVKKPHMINIEKSCIQYMPLHWGALTMFIKQKAAQQHPMRSIGLVLSRANCLKAGKSASLIWIWALPPAPWEPPPPPLAAA